ncbi:MAG: hypothetical protein HIU89_15895 [Proteobacteria bacterium]|nr:hypothetical protein [Pseudomonadota bacterium]
MDVGADASLTAQGWPVDAVLAFAGVEVGVVVDVAPAAEAASLLALDAPGSFAVNAIYASCCRCFLGFLDPDSGDCVYRLDQIDVQRKR